MKNIPIIRRLNEEWHEIALYIYTAIVVAHWAGTFKPSISDLGFWVGPVNKLAVFWAYSSPF
jgi:hypothetical protein